MNGYKQIEHTADIGIEVEGNSLKELFINSAKGLVSLMVDARAPMNRVAQGISITAGSKEELLVKWLEELLYIFETKRMVPTGFTIVMISENDLSAVINIDEFDKDRFPPKYQIKAVTYHNLTIKEKDGRFSATIIFDI